ncbi:MAG: N-acetyl-gamma-glutamyl-phosphate reductase [Alphaproteobacteria bacterium]|nr:N-acetyl-gamma-glutamyl-phosphate reductase [Alphaproteobacteria bacterium]
MTDKKKIAILGASGYTGAELMRLLALHPHVAITALAAERSAGQPVWAVYPHLAGVALPDMVKIDAIDFSKIDLVFCCLPHATTQKVIAALPANLKVIDLSADFRLKDTAAYAQWYGHEHHAPDLQKTAVYGLTEINRDAVRAARLVANPGCYPTAAQLPLIPLLRKKQIEPGDIIVDAKSGVSGAGRDAKPDYQYCEVTDGMRAYGVASHRHTPEIEQGLSEAFGKPVTINFTPHLVPMSRGILASIYVKHADGTSANGLRDTLNAAYAKEPFVHVLPAGASASTRNLRGSNHCVIGVFADRVPGRAIIISVIDNLVKGASGQAVQNMNAMFGWPETTALEQPPLFP